MLLYDYIQSLKDTCDKWKQRALQAEIENDRLKKKVKVTEKILHDSAADIQELSKYAKKTEALASRRLLEIQNMNRAVEKVSKREQHAKSEALQLRDRYRTSLGEKRTLEQKLQKVNSILLIVSMKIGSIIHHRPGTSMTPCPGFPSRAHYGIFRAFALRPFIA